MDDNKLSNLWWEAKSDRDVFDSALADYETLRDVEARQDRFYTYERIYRNEDIDKSTTLEAELMRFGRSLDGYSRASYNLIATCNDNIVSRIVRNKPRAVYQVSDANWSLRRTAKNQQKWVDHIAHKEFFPSIGRDIVNDGCLLGVGHAKIAKKYREAAVGVWYVHPGDLFVDPVETAHSQPRRMFQRQFVSKDIAQRWFPDKKEQKALENSSVLSQSDFTERRPELSGTPILAQTEIIEAWHPPTYPGADDGIHIIFCSGGLLFREKWTREDFPIISYRWKRRPGDMFHGIAVPEEIMGLHIDLNFSIQMIYETAETSGGNTIVSPVSAKLSKAEFTNAPDSIWEYQGQVPPTVLQHPKVHMDLMQLANDQEARAYRRLGLDSATPNQPSAGLETGRAVRMDFDARSMSLTQALQNYENLYKDFGDKATAAGRQIWEKDKSFSVVVPRNKYSVEQMNWEDVSLNPRSDSFIIKVTAGSQLSQHPAGRIDDVNSMVTMGAVTDQAEMRDLMSLADLENSDSLATAALDAVKWMCEEMLDDGVAHKPEPYDDLDLCLSTSNAIYLRARSQKAPEDRLDLLRAFLDECNLLISTRDIQAAAQTEGALVGATPPSPDAAGQNPSATTGNL